MDRNFELIAVVAHEASRVVGSGTAWTDLDADRRGVIMETTLAAARGEDITDRFSPERHRQAKVFAAAVTAALTYNDGQGGFAIEEITDLGNFMVDEMGFDPEANAGTSITGSAKQMLAEQREELAKLKDAHFLEANSAFEVEERRKAALGFAIDSPGARDRNQIVERAKTFEEYLEGPARLELSTAPITRAELLARGTDPDLDESAIKAIYELGWPSRMFPLGRPISAEDISRRGLEPGLQVVAAAGTFSDAKQGIERVPVGGSE
jgi:hypothetical protein